MEGAAILRSRSEVNAACAHARGSDKLVDCSLLWRARASTSDHLAPPRYALFENHSGGWYRYQDHLAEVELPRYLPDPAPGYVTPLSSGAAEYDYATQNGSTNIGAWIDAAAQALGR